MGDKKAKKLKWTTPILECFDKSRMSHGADCSPGSIPGISANCTPGVSANGCNTGTGATGCGVGNGPIF